MIAVATTESELAGVCDRLQELGARPVQVVAPGGDRRVVLASVDDGRSEASLAASLRAEGAMAVTRPDGGAPLRAWRRDTRPVTVGGRISVCLAWSEHERGHLEGLVELGPGGFGSGHHPTTRQILEELADRISGGERVLDVGCGSGILGLCALKLGAARVVAVDIKPDAVAAAQRNAQANGMAGRMEATLTAPGGMGATLAASGGMGATLAASGGMGATLGASGGMGATLGAPDRFDVVLANIARAGIVELAPELVSHLSPDGWLAVGGISPSQCSQVAGFLRPLTEVAHRASGEWATLVLSRPDRNVSQRRPTASGA